MAFNPASNLGQSKNESPFGNQRTVTGFLLNDTTANPSVVDLLSIATKNETMTFVRIWITCFSNATQERYSNEYTSRFYTDNAGVLTVTNVSNTATNTFASAINFTVLATANLFRVRVNSGAAITPGVAQSVDWEYTAIITEQKKRA
jgi:hypothetical protein